MAAAVAAAPLGPRPIAVWEPSNHFVTKPGAKNSRAGLKQLQESSPAVRSRRERPCDGCRRRRSKCVPQESQCCVLCEFHGQRCTFVEQVQPRKRKALDDVARKSNRGAHARSRSPTASTTTSNTTQTTTADSSPQFSGVRTVRRPKAGPPVPLPLVPGHRGDGKPFAVDETLSLQRHRHCTYVGQTTALDASLIGLGSFNGKNETESRLGNLRRVTSTEYFSTHADADVPMPDDEARALAEIDATVGPHGPALIEIYFRHVHPSYPCLQKLTFMDRHRHGDRQFNPPLLAAIYLLALQWWDHEPALAPHAKPDVARLEYIAVTSLTISMQRPKVSAVQAGLLLLQRPRSSTWTLTVQLVALGQDIGLHLDCSNWSIPAWERRLRKRLAWALYVQDKWSALMHGRPSHINAADWAVQPLVPEDFDESIAPLPSPPEEEDPMLEHGRTVFMQMISLTAIMAEVCATFYSQTAKDEYARAGRYTTRLVLNHAKPVQIKLKDWFAKLPAECKMDISSSSSSASPFASSFSPSAGYLHLAYFATEISIHRRIVQSLSTASDPYLLYICRSAAKTRLISAMDFVNRIRPAHLDAFWFFASASNFALIGTFGALLMATSPAREEADFYAARLGEYRWTLGVSSRKAGWMNASIEILDANCEMLAGLPEKPPAASVEAGLMGQNGMEGLEMGNGTNENGLHSEELAGDEDEDEDDGDDDGDDDYDGVDGDDDDEHDKEPESQTWPMDGVVMEANQ